LWTLLLEGYFYNTGEGNCSFALSAQGNTPPTLPAGTAFSLGDLVTGTLAANVTNVYRLTLAQPAMAVFDSRTNVWQVSWNLAGPFGQVVSSSNFRDADSSGNAAVLALPAGDYALSVTGYNGYSGDYGFRLFDFASATPISPGTNVTGTLSPANATTGYQLAITAGERLFFKSPGGFPGSPTWRLVDPYGDVVFNTYFNNDQGPFTFTVPGSYTLLIEGSIYDTTPVDYSFLVSPVTDGSQALVLGATVSGNIGQPGQAQRYTFSLPQPARVYFDSLTNQNPATWTLDGPAGRVVDHRSLSYSDGYRNFSFYTLPAGDYTLTLAGNGDQTPGYSFRLFTESNGAQPLTLGTTVNGTLATPAQVQRYTFTLTTTNRLYFDSLTNRSDMQWTLDGPAGRVVDHRGFYYSDGYRGFSSFLLSPGSYTLSVNGTGNATGGFRFRLLDLGAATAIATDTPITRTLNYAFQINTDTDGSQALALGSTVNGSIATPGQAQRYNFTLATAKLLYSTRSSARTTSNGRSTAR
jgi:hypothetical protein